MKTLYAVTFLCLSFPALADVLDITPIRADEDNTATASLPAPQPIEDHSVGAVVDFYVGEYNVGHVTDVLDVTPIGDNTPTASVPAPQPIEDHSVGAVGDFYVDEYDVGFITTPAIKPIDGAEFEGTSRDDAYAMCATLPTLHSSIDTMIEDDDYTAGVTSPAAPKVEDKPISPSLDFSVDDEGWEFKLPVTIGESSTELGVWP